MLGRGGLRVARPSQASRSAPREGEGRRRSGRGAQPKLHGDHSVAAIGMRGGLE